MRIVAISDTHLREKPPVAWPVGDILVHCGDATSRGTAEELERFGRFLGTLPYEQIVFTYGNHDFLGETNRPEADALIRAGLRPEQSIDILIDEEVTVSGVRFYGAPWQPRFFDWAFNLDRGADLKERWDLIPDGIDVLITHGPPVGILDRVPDGQEVGCVDLANAVQRVRPKVHCFGHIHDSYGWTERNGIQYFNCAQLSEQYKWVNPPMVFDV